MVSLGCDFEDRAAEFGTAAVRHTEEMAQRVAYEFTDGFSAAGRNIKVVEYGRGPGVVSRRGGDEPIRHSVAPEHAVADRTTLVSCPDEGAAVVLDYTALRVRSFGTGKIVKDRFRPGCASSTGRRELVDDAATDDVVEAVRALTCAALKRRSVESPGSVQQKLPFRNRSVLPGREVVQRHLGPCRWPR